MTLITHLPGFPAIGAKRELKFLVESFFRNEISETELETGCRALRRRHWQMQADAGMTWLSVNDFSLYDHVLDMSLLLGVVPERFKNRKAITETVIRFLMARGSAGVPACEMTKWFDTNYHYIVPELIPGQTFQQGSTKLTDELKEVSVLKLQVKPLLLGPLSFLWLAKSSEKLINKLTLLPQLMECYREILTDLSRRNVTWVQLDEPILTLDLPTEWVQAFQQVYAAFQDIDLKILLATYFGGIEHHYPQLEKLPVEGIHIDAIRAPQQLSSILPYLGNDRVLSAGVVDGRNIWRNDLCKTYEALQPLYQALGEKLWISASCSLMHVPVDLTSETAMAPALKSRLAFAVQKLAEITRLADALQQGEIPEKFTQTSSQPDSAVRNRCQTVTPDMYTRAHSYAKRRPLQDKALHLPLLPVTTIGSFPQTADIRTLRQQLKNGTLARDVYDKKIHAHIRHVIQQQTDLGLDVLVHGEAERNDMVEFFADQLAGFAATQHGWVRSYGTRCVKPPVIYADVSRLHPMTVSLSRYAQSLSKKPVKGMLTGPVTMMAWSFVRDDQPEMDTAKQIALALRDEVMDLEAAGIQVIQIDEPAFREKLPLRECHWSTYLAEAVICFGLASCGVRDETQIHTHMCYSEFNDIIDAIARLDADVISIETSRSHMALLQAFKKFSYPNSIGPGVYDIHSPRIPTAEEMISLIDQAAKFIPIERLWINPDCGLKTRQWSEVMQALENMISAARTLRKKYEKCGVV